MAREYWRMVAKGTPRDEAFETIKKNKHLQEKTRKGENEIVQFEKAIKKIKKEQEAQIIKEGRELLVKNRLGC